jgi:hypothetical protein
MIRKAGNSCRGGASIVEAALVMPVTFFLIFGLLVGAIGIFRYQQCAHISRETARYASVHGAKYAYTNAAAIAAGWFPDVNDDYLTNTIAAGNASGLDTTNLNVAVSMVVMQPGATSPDQTMTYDWDNVAANGNRSPYSAWVDNSQTPPVNVEVTNIVIVEVTYTWVPDLYLAGPITLTSKSVMPMSF